MKKMIIACAVVLAACLSSCGDTNYCYEVTTKFPTLTGGTDEEKITVKVGERVMYDKYAGTSVKIDGEEYLILKNSDIIAVIEN